MRFTAMSGIKKKNYATKYYRFCDPFQRSGGRVSSDAEQRERR